jgi:GNAT superfamily N-acetyltransferase
VSPADVVVRARQPDDLPVLVGLLGEQQAASSYPIRWPMPFPVERFLVRRTELCAWVAEVDGEVVGHVAVTEVDRDLADAFLTATGTREPADVAMVSVLFTGTAARGLGAGGRLLDTAVAWIRERRRVPVLDVVPTHHLAAAMYARRGWVEVGRTRFAWQADDLPDVVLMALPPYPSSASSTAP